MADSNLLAAVDEIQSDLETFYLQQSNKIQNLKATIKTLSAHHMSCSINSDDIRFSQILAGQVVEMVEQLKDSAIPPKILVNTHHDASIGGSSSDRDTLVTLIATDGSIKTKHGRKVAASAVGFGYGSPLNTSRMVINSSSTLYPEVDALLLALNIAKSHNQDSILLITDNSTALKFFVASITSSITSSSTLQNLLANHPDLQATYSQIKDLSKNFKFLAIRWQKAHTNSRILDTYSELNSIADTLANTKADEILNILTT